MKYMRVLFSFVLLVGIGFLTACQTPLDKKDEGENKVPPVTEPNETETSKTTYPLKLKTYDGDGKDIEQIFTKAPTRIVTNNLSVTEVLIELGLGDRIVGTVKPDNAVTSKYAEAVNKIYIIGDKKTLSKEKVLELDPEIIVGRTMMMTNTNMGSVLYYNDMDIPVYTQKASVDKKGQSLTHIIEDIKNLGLIFDVQVKANAYAKELEDALDSVMETLKTIDTTFKKAALVMTAFDGNTFGAFQSELHQSALELLGYTNLGKAGAKSTLENLISMNPEFILYVTSDRNKALDTTAISTLKSNETLSEVSAIKNGKILEINYDFFMDYGPQVIFAVEEICNFLYS